MKAQKNQQQGFKPAHTAKNLISLFKSLFSEGLLPKVISFFVLVATLLLLLSQSNSFAQTDDELLWSNNVWGDKIFFSPIGNLLSVSGNEQVTLINSTTGGILKTFNTVMDFSTQKFSHNGKIFAFASPNDSSLSGNITFIDTKTLNTIRVSKILSNFFDFSLDNKYFITANVNDGGLFIKKYDINTDSLISYFSFPFIPTKYDIWLTDFSVSPIGKNIAINAGEMYDAHTYSSYCKIINLDSNKIIGNFSSTEPYFKYSNTGILGSLDSGRINFYDENAKLIKTLNNWTRDFCFNDEGNEILTASDTVLKIWNYETLKLKRTYYNPVFGDGPGRVAYSDINHILAVIAGGTYGFNYSRIDWIKENSEKRPAINIIPNPAANQIMLIIQKENLRTISLQVTDITGVILFRKDYLNINSNNFSTTINTMTLPNGTVFFNLTIDGILFNKKVQIVK